AGAPSLRRARLAIAAGVAQIPLWLNLADMSARGLVPTDSSATRRAAAAVCLGMAAACLTGVHLFTSRLVRSVSMVSSSASPSVSITSHALFSKPLEVPVRYLHTTEAIASSSSSSPPSRSANKPAFVILSDSRRRTNMMLARDGRFPDPKTFDALFRR
ncbi:hypothetical protein HDU84_007300, partial [Entophlyctis sp. JEL0112]